MGRRYKQGVDRHQGLLLPERVEDYVDDDNSVRALDAYVDSLDLESLGFTHSEERVGPGQPAYPPQALLKLYLYGYLHKVRSSRKLEQECHRNLEVIWLLEGLRPNNKTIANFRKDNAKALRSTHRDFVLLCRELDLYGRELVAIDGAFFRGSAGSKGIHTRKGLRQRLKRLEADIARYLAALDDADAKETSSGEASAASLKEKLAALRERQARESARLAELEASGERQLSEVDPDARQLQKSGQRVRGYNVQMAVDERHKLLVDGEVTNAGNDRGQLQPMAERARGVLDVEELTVVADAGYFHLTQLKGCEASGITAYVPEPRARGRSASPQRLPRDAFTYEARTDRYRCPQGEWLSRTRACERDGKQVIGYASQPRACAECPLRNACLPKRTPYREIYRWEHEAWLEESYRPRMAAHGKAYLKQRAALAEHPFGTLKRWCGWDHFLVRGLTKVRGEMSLLMLSYNFRRVLNLLGMEGFRQALAARAAKAREAELSDAICRFLRECGLCDYQRLIPSVYRWLGSNDSSRPHYAAA